MSQDKLFASGMIVKPRGNAPDWVIAKVSIKAEEFIQTLQQHQKNGWINIDLKRSQGGKAYAEIDTWQPDSSACTGYTTNVQQQAPQRQAPPPPPFPPDDDNFQGLGTNDEPPF